MEEVSIILTSNRGSYENNELILSEFEQLNFSGAPRKIFNTVENFETTSIQSFIDEHPDNQIVGFISYDLGFQWTEGRLPEHPPIGNFPYIWMAALDQPLINSGPPNHQPIADTLPVQLTPVINKNEYTSKVLKLKEHIQAGDIYEVNYCIPFVAENISIDPEVIYHRLNHFTPMPFSALINTDSFAIISASPERFIKKKENKLTIQPMKGTRARVKGNEDADKQVLQLDIKERSENVMIVDLSRNDLSKLAKKGTVQVEELFGVYQFPSVLQMISTISCEIDPNEKFEHILQATFPMGSMTGAPKKRAMQLIDKNECFARGPYAGMLGYISPENNFDFSVLIRTIFYDKVNRKLFVAVGSAITSGSDVEKEYEECLLKLRPLLQALNATLV